MEPLPPAGEAIIPYVVEARAKRQPNGRCASDATGTSWTNAQARDEMYRAANWLDAKGIGQGDRVAIVLPNSLDWLRTWWGAALLGASVVPINPAFRGELLHQVLTESKSKIVVTNEALSGRVLDTEVDIDVVDSSLLGQGGDTRPDGLVDLHLWDEAWIGYTSGTTGPSKGAVISHLGIWRWACLPEFEPVPSDVFLVFTPLFHVSGASFAVCALLSGGGVALRPAFSARRFLDDVRESGATFTILVASMSTFLAATPEKPDDHDNPLRAVDMVPLPPEPEKFRRRFGIDKMITAYGMTEMGLMLIADWPGEIEKPTATGKPRAGIEVRIVDEHDLPVPQGQQGELVLRSERPWELTTGYVERPHATAEAWRNGWFHTGDQFWQDDDGYFYFVDRLTDSVRRRGENISSFEVERAVVKHQAVLDAACVGVPNERGEQEVKVFVVPREGQTIDPKDLIEHLIPLLPYFAIPRFIETLDELPKTPSARVKKFELRRASNDSAWDRERHAVQIRRDY